ncbi:DNA primase [Tuberibacillus sp. Marseille-P3662]|uniref:DNA primase n=1 Tax=Tuberibacillus sp. Marseille-P3662 TaxID=1965358 RepID=UPI000A1CEC6C|nr:DNA primase [Tuberibacillus sp. Marseille-P3662]
MPISQETIDRIRTSIDIIDVIGEYVQLKKQGRSHLGLCPFHNERTPSFSVSADKQIFHCFGCHMGGNVYTFLMEIEGIDFVEAVRLLGEKTQIPIPEIEHYTNHSSKNQTQEQLYHGLELLTKFYSYLLKESKYGNGAKTYLYDRGFTDESIEKFQLGYAVDAWETATEFLANRKVSLDQLEKAGLVSKREFDGKFFDRFRNRIIFPITNHRGKPVALAGRVLDESKPKYLNTPESNIFHKGQILYAYHLARPNIKKQNQVILFEGYVDVIKAHQAGVTNAVASMGTSLTDNQASMLARNAETIIICYDSDEAGIQAAFRASELLKPYDRTIKIANMPKDMDPDDYIDRYGGDRFQSDVLGASRTLMAFKMEYHKLGRNLNDEGERLRYIETTLYDIAKLSKAVERDHYLRHLADEFSLSLDALKQQQFQIYKQMKQQQHQTDRQQTFTIQQNHQDPHKLSPAHLTAERQLLAHMLRDPDIAERVKTEIGGQFSDDMHQALAAYLYAYFEEDHLPDVSGFIQILHDAELQKRATEIAMIQINEDVSDREISDYIRQITNYNKRLAIGKKEEEKKAAEGRNDMTRAAEILSEIIMLKKNLNEQ